VVITADEGLRGGKHVPLKANVDEALEGLAHGARPCWWCAAPARVADAEGRDLVDEPR
jgi:acetyl-CoA synthetase